MEAIDLPAVELVARLRARTLSAAELLEATLARAAQIAPALNPFALELFEPARGAAARADRQLARGQGGPLCGLPVTVKDSQWLAGVPCANGSRSLRDFVPAQSSAAVQRLLDAGAVVFAKTTCPEFSLIGITESRLYGRTANPWNPARTPGGSSGGAATAVAAGAGTLALGGDGGGSIRIPAAFCGVVGFKPTFGAVPREPCFPSWKSLVAYGPLARSVADARLMYSVLAAEPALADAAPAAGLDGVRIAVSEDLGFAPVDADVRQAFRQLLVRLREAGADLVDDDPGLPSSVATWAVTATYDAWQHRPPPGDHGADIEHVTHAIFDFGARFSAAEYDSAQARRGFIADAYTDLFARTGARVLLTPALGCEAFPHGRVHPARIEDTAIGLPWLDWAGFLYDANLTGMPACVVPMGLGERAMPVSAQVQGLPGEDAAVLDIAGRIEALSGWERRLPPR